MKQFSEQQIVEIFNKQVNLPDSYFTKHARLGDCPIKSWNHSWNGKDFPRTWCVKDFAEWVTKHKLNHVGVLGYTCDTDPELEFISHDSKILLKYPDYDLHAIPDHFKNTFDFFLFNQTIEHLYNPFMAIESLYKTIKPGGYVFTSVPTLNIPHSTPIHYNGFNPMGLAMLFKCAGFDIVEIGQWGNYDYISKLWKTHSWPAYEDLNRNGIVTNERQNVCQCWILARRPN